MTQLVEVLIAGLLAGAVYSLIAAGLALEFGVLRVVNFAHGYLVMLSMYLFAMVFQGLGWSPYVAVVVSIPIAAAAGAALYLGLIRPFMDRGASPIVVALATLALSVGLEQGVLWLSGAEPKPVRLAGSLTGWNLFGVHISVVWVIAATVATLTMALLAVLLRTTRWGRNARAVAMDADAAAAMGISPVRVSTSVFAMGTVLAAIAGAILITLVPAAPDRGLTYSEIAIVVVVLGGLSSFKGAWLGGLIIGVVSNLVGFYWDPGLQSAAYLVVFVLVLVVRPQGLFGHAGDVGAIRA